MCEEGFGKYDYFVSTTEWINLDVSHQQLFTLQKVVARRFAPTLHTNNLCWISYTCPKYRELK